MKKFISVLALFLAFGLTVYAQDTVAPADAPATEEGAQMDFEAELVDYGTIEQGSDPYRFFNFTNTGTEPLVITHAKGSCGCTVPTYPKEPILPGETGQIKVRYDTNRLGPFTKRVTLTTNASDENTVLTIKGKVEKKPEQPEGVPTNEGGMFNNN